MAGKEKKSQKAIEREVVLAAEKKPVKLSFKEKQELQALPSLIEDAEKELASIDEKLADPEFYKSGADAGALTAKRNELEENLMNYLERWEELEQKQNAAQS